MSGNGNSGRKLGARPPPFRLAELELLDLEAEVMPHTKSTWEGQLVLEALRRRRVRLGELLAGARWRTELKAKPVVAGPPPLSEPDLELMP